MVAMGFYWFERVPQETLRTAIAPSGDGDNLFEPGVDVHHNRRMMVAGVGMPQVSLHRHSLI